MGDVEMDGSEYRSECLRFLNGEVGSSELLFIIDNFRDKYQGRGWEPGEIKLLCKLHILLLRGEAFFVGNENWLQEVNDVFFELPVRGALLLEAWRMVFVEAPYGNFGVDIISTLPPESQNDLDLAMELTKSLGLDVKSEEFMDLDVVQGSGKTDRTEDEPQ